MFVITQINSPSTTSSGVDAAVLCLAAHAVMLAATSLNLTAISVVKIPATDQGNFVHASVASAVNVVNVNAIAPIVPAV